MMMSSGQEDKGGSTIGLTDDGGEGLEGISSFTSLTYGQTLKGDRVSVIVLR